MNNINQENNLQQPQLIQPVKKDKNIFKHLFIISIILLLIITVAEYFFLTAKINNLSELAQSQANTMNEVTPTPPAVTTVTSTESKDVVIKGKICYPSDFIPDGDILVKNIQTNKTERFPFTFKSKNQNFSISIKEGNYIFAYEVDDSKPKGYYSKCALTTQSDDCSTTESHKPIIVSVQANTIIEDIILCDYYYKNGEEPSF